MSQYQSDRYQDDRRDGRDVEHLRHPYIFPAVAGAAVVAVLIMAVMEGMLR
ncbi:hypothetical protein [Falsiroseomonas sp.]|jgi:hypothetical protein|uniref:hypothetical protein n=1 Tax=Falsiroseomonas sp. TaxID=2870721 RepID=UPI00271C43FF|nr:hypothetical protein [Falsiroseomonas sp.]MDO9503455.1 hypothetical protein [Falsiroseomonas sp.]MDP3419117.1 hypothetical protein [Falsiroseomonas sp.]